jgi:uncharacterized Zn finger protein (UPF0148 family)
MTLTLIIVCGNCGGYLLAKEENKTRTCPYCGHTVVVQKAKKAASARNAYEASATLRRLKSESALTKKRSTLE